MNGVVLSQHAAAEAGYVPWQRAIRAMGAASRTNLYTYRAAIQSVLVTPTRGRRPEKWYLEDDCLAVRDRRNISGRVGSLATRWSAIPHGHRTTTPTAPGQPGKVADLKADGWLFASEIAIEVGRLLSMQKPPHVETIRKLPHGTINLVDGPGHYKRCRIEDIEAALPELRRLLLRERSGWYTLEEAAKEAEREGGPSLKTILELVRTERIPADRERRPYLVEKRRFRRYLQTRAPTDRRAQEALPDDRYWLKSAATYLGIGRGLLERGVKTGHIEPVQRRGRSLIFTRADLDRVAAERPACTCGCGAVAWTWRPTLPGHHMGLTATKQVRLALRRARALARTTEDPATRDAAAMYARGLCEIRRRCILGRRGRAFGSPIDDASTVLYALIVTAKLDGLGDPDGSTAVGLTRTAYEWRVSFLLDAGSHHGRFVRCTACSML
jgi:hypothetical protein